jgi:antitoxin component YwqK of YwqJK toxin-antitoxin module
LLTSLLGSCLSQQNLGPPPPQARPDSNTRTEVRRKHDPETGKLVHEWTLAFPPGKPSVKHGKDTIWSASGVKQWEREYKYGKPYGAWRSWYESGKPRSECFYGDPEVDTRMTFWHANGHVSLQGPARNGSRRGEWKIWYANGQLAEQGKFVDSQREGEWLAWSEDGSEAWKRTYRRNIRVAQVPVTPSTAVEAAVP